MTKITCLNCNFTFDTQGSVTVGSHCPRCNTWNTALRDCTSNCHSCYHKAGEKLGLDNVKQVCQSKNNKVTLTFMNRLLKLLRFNT